MSAMAWMLSQSASGRSPEPRSHPGDHVAVGLGCRQRPLCRSARSVPSHTIRHQGVHQPVDVVPRRLDVGFEAVLAQRRAGHRADADEPGSASANCRRLQEEANGRGRGERHVVGRRPPRRAARRPAARPPSRTAPPRRPRRRARAGRRPGRPAPTPPGPPALATPARRPAPRPGPRPRSAPAPRPRSRRARTARERCPARSPPPARRPAPGVETGAQPDDRTAAARRSGWSGRPGRTRETSGAGPSSGTILIAGASTTARPQTA